ncbi:N-6 DNA methylase [Thiohalobacter thiocyanaticus]|uniref:site-specific DNA-methyltransferase (adenine-specific) n=1 Tax=Thiohalobacter thiocyanaticus TaxID=585455 RepID=A0A1Z4VLY0_9GAMM|nr:class I SAM-dependent DNA methyltransferase [Thiohalobacter thiocyanaticus]BAZ92611.1 N-6 DNA methylase [Thiohalobacter thiocyanaticus]
MTENFSSTAAFIWSVADLLRGDFKQSQYGRIILPFTLLRRLECVLAPSKAKVLKEYDKRKESGLAIDGFLKKAAGLPFYNTSPMDLSALGETQILDNLDTYIRSFSSEARDIFEHFGFFGFLEKLDEANLLYLVVQKFATMDLSPKTLNNYHMGLVFEELIRRFAESSNETAGEHFTPRDIVRLTTALLFTTQQEKIAPGKIVTVYDPTAGTGGFLSEGEEYIHSISEQARVTVFGQELNPESYAICKGDMLVKGHEIQNIKLGNTLSDDQLTGQPFDFMLSNPPFGVDWKKVQKQVQAEHKNKGFAGRFGPGLPRVSDGSLLFLMHLMSKMRDPKEGGSRIGIILNGSPLFTGGAGSGESEIRRYILEHDLLEAIVALPTDMFYNTGIATYVWILSNNKIPERRGKVQLINATDMGEKMRKSLGSKRKYLTEDSIDAIVKQYGDFKPSETCKIFKTTDFGYRRITVERPLQLAFYPKDEIRLAALQADKGWAKLDASLQQAILDALARFEEEKVLSRTTFKKWLKVHMDDEKLPAPAFKLLQKHLGEHDEEAELCKAKGQAEPDPELRDYENVPLSENIRDYFQREVLPHVPNAWIDETKKDERDGQVGIVGYEIPFNRHFYKYVPPRPLEEIDADLDKVSQEIMGLLSEVHA